MLANLSIAKENLRQVIQRKARSETGKDL
jgi:hypothetical protein